MRSPVHRKALSALGNYVRYQVHRYECRCGNQINSVADLYKKRADQKPNPAPLPFGSFFRETPIVSDGRIL
jgi:hypothetical protein